MEKLRNLDGREITKQERSEAGYVVSSSEEESDGESSEDETENNETKRKLESKIDREYGEMVQILYIQITCTLPHMNHTYLLDVIEMGVALAIKTNHY